MVVWLIFTGLSSGTLLLTFVFVVSLFSLAYERREQR